MRIAVSRAVGRTFRTSVASRCERCCCTRPLRRVVSEPSTTTPVVVRGRTGVRAMWCASRGACGACLAPRRAARARRSAGGARAPCRSRGSACAPRALFGIGQKSGASSGQTLADIEAEIDAAAPASSTAATAQLSLADAVWKVSKETPMSLRDRAACAIAAEAVQALCETGLERASLVVTLALAEALRRNGFESEGVRTVAGYLVGDDDEAVAHCWLEVDGAPPDRPRRHHFRSRRASSSRARARASRLTPVSSHARLSNSTPYP